MSAHDPSDPTLKLVDLAKRAHHAAPARVDAASFYAFESKLARRRVRVRILQLGLVAALTAAVGALMFSRRAPEPVPLAYRVFGESPALGVSSHIKFTDGSEIAVEAESTLEVRSTTARGARLSLDHGRARVKVVPRAHNDWWLRAGPYTVHVTGTKFALSWLPAEERFELELEHGQVVVRGPMAETGVALTAGQRLIGEPARRHLEISRLPAQQEPSASTPAGPAQAPEVTQASTAATTPARREANARGAGSASPDFSQLVAEGRFADVVRTAEARGVGPLLRQLAAPELVALADAARYQGEAALAHRALSALRQRFPHSPEGRSASYFLARVSGPRHARAWYRRYLAEQPDGNFVSPALGALMSLQLARGQRADAVRSARGYLAREPNGPYAAAARELLAQQTLLDARPLAP